MKYFLIKKEDLEAIGFTNYGKELGDGTVVVPSNVKKTLESKIDFSGYEEYSLDDIKKME